MRSRSGLAMTPYAVFAACRRVGVVVEVDGFAFHSSPHSFENDRRRDAQLTASGVTVMRLTWRQIVHEPEAMLVHLAQTLGRTGLYLVRDGGRQRGRS